MINYMWNTVNVLREEFLPRSQNIFDLCTKVSRSTHISFLRHLVKHPKHCMKEAFGDIHSYLQAKNQTRIPMTAAMMRTATRTPIMIPYFRLEGFFSLLVIKSNRSSRLPWKKKNKVRKQTEVPFTSIVTIHVFFFMARWYYWWERQVFLFYFFQNANSK